MVAPTRPASVSTFGAEKWSYVPTIANINAPTAVEINAAGSLDLSCYLFEDSGKPTQTTNRVTRKRRICDTAAFEQIGVTSYQGAELAYSIAPQAAATTDGVKAFEKLATGTVGFFVRRLGIDVLTDFTTGQFVDVFPIAVGPGMPNPMGDGEAAEAGVTQTFAITGPVSFRKAIV